jgi:hypothetical protein
LYRKFLNARSPLRLLEKGLRGGLGAGNLGVVLAGPGVGKTGFLVGVALDDLLRSQRVLHVALDQTVAHVRAFYDTLFEELAGATHLQDSQVTHAEIDQLRSIRVYRQSELSAEKLREAVAVEAQAGGKPVCLLIDGLSAAAVQPDELAKIKSLAGEIGAEVWLSIVCPAEKVESVPDAIRRAGDTVSVILALEPGRDSVRLRALKEHDNPDVEALHVALDPRTLLLIRS